MNPSEIINLVIICGIAAVAYGWFASNQILKAEAGNKTMQEIYLLENRIGVLSDFDSKKPQ